MKHPSFCLLLLSLEDVCIQPQKGNPMLCYLLCQGCQENPFVWNFTAPVERR